MKKTIIWVTVFLINAALFAQTFEPMTLEFVCELKVTTEKPVTISETAYGARRYSVYCLKYLTINNQIIK